MQRSLYFVPLCGLLLIGAASAESFYKWVDADGVTHYGEAPPEQQPTDLVDVTANKAREAAPVTATKERGVVIYTKRWCKECDAAKHYFQKQQIHYTEYDVEESARGKEDYRRLRGRRVPIILVGDHRLDEFTPAAFEALQTKQP